MADYQPITDLQGYFKAGEREAIFNACTCLRDQILIRLLWRTGRRITEILNVKVGEIDFENANILWHIEKKKRKVGNDALTDKPIYAKRDYMVWKPIDRFTLSLIQQYISEEGHGPENYLFASKVDTSKPISRIRAFLIVRELSKKAGINFVGTKRPHPHHFRHSFAVEISKKLQSPSDIRKLQRIMEHSNIGTTEQYLQFGNEELRSLIEDESEPSMD